MQNLNSNFFHKLTEIISIIIIQSKKMSSLFREQKDLQNQTSETFNPKGPLQERSGNENSHPFVTQIQELMYALTRKKADLRETKLQKSNLSGRSQQQDARIKDIKITMEHAAEKEELARENNERLCEEIAKVKETLRQMTFQIKGLKEKVVEKGEKIIETKKEKILKQEEASDLEWRLKEKQKENQTIDLELQNIERVVNSKQNQIRSKQDEVSHKMLQKIELATLITFLEEKIKNTMKNRHEATCEQKEVVKQITKCEQKVTSVKKQIEQANWNAQQSEYQNQQIQELNTKLLNDYEASKKHLGAMRKANQILQNALQEYGATGEQVTQIINSVRNTH